MMTDLKFEETPNRPRIETRKVIDPETGLLVGCQHQDWELVTRNGKQVWKALEWAKP